MHARIANYLGDIRARDELATAHGDVHRRAYEAATAPDADPHVPRLHMLVNAVVRNVLD